MKDRGVKQAPFVVLIGAAMPSVLAEISFVSHQQEASLMKTKDYRQKIAEALFDAVKNYQGSLKAVGTVASFGDDDQDEPTTNASRDERSLQRSQSRRRAALTSHPASGLCDQAYAMQQQQRTADLGRRRSQLTPGHDSRSQQQPGAPQPPAQPQSTRSR